MKTHVKLPFLMNKKEIQKIYQKYKVPKHIVAHMKKVAEICSILANKLLKKGIKIEKELLLKAALLHDVLRISDIMNFNLKEFGEKIPKSTVKIWENLRKKYKKIKHEKAAYLLLKSINQPKIASLVRKHDFYLIDKLKTLEEKILYYADKRVDFDKIVTLKNRFKTGRKRNNRPEDDMEKVAEIEKKIYKLEKELKLIIGDFKL